MKFAFNGKFVRKDVYKTDKYDFVKFVVSADNRNMYFNVNNNRYTSDIYNNIISANIEVDTPVRVIVDFVKDRRKNYYYCNLIAFAPVVSCE